MSTLAVKTDGRVPLAALTAVCVMTCVVVAAANRSKPFIGTPDEAAYAHQADRIIAGKGFTVSYVQHFFRPSADIEHPEDHYGVGNGVLIAAAFAVLGRSEFAATIPALFLGLLVLPVLTYLAARRCDAEPWAAVGAGVFVLLCRPVLVLAHHALVDPQFTAAVLAAWVATTRNQGGSRRAFLSSAAGGAILGLAYWLKPAALLLAPGLVGTLMLAGGPIPARSRLPAVCALLATFGLVISPWLMRNTVVFGDPLYTANQFIGPGEDYRADWVRSDFRRVWWAGEGEPLVTTRELVRTYGWPKVAGVALGRLGRAVGGEARYPFIVLGACMVLLRRRPAVLAIGGLVGSYALLLAILFPVHDRYLLIIWPAAAAVGAGVVTSFSSWVSAGARAGRWGGQARWRPGTARHSVRILLERVAPIILALVLSAPGLRLLGPEAKNHLWDGRAMGETGEELATRRAAEWLKGALPEDARVMVQDCWRVAYYAPQPLVNIPTDDAHAVAAVVTHYRVDYIMLVRSGTYSRVIPYARAYLGERHEWQRLSGTPPDLELWGRVGESSPEDGDEG